MTNTKIEQVRYYLERLYKRTRYGKSTDDKPTDAEVGQETAFAGRLQHT